MCMYMLLLIFGFLHKKNKKYIYTKKNTYIDIYIYIYFGRNPKNKKSEKRMLECP